ncbi:small integral membrane protein 20 isoform X3 [Gopherus flavomarginatus]|uniref:small integral membrane protein 20 isoform X3 n=1 Tax=Gopherus flavomarginatus TaxID=286002 RepID=UPI0021CC1154|nr:small integral membrane protein 20 isoform X3 [Gopherus flavomarginatus]
MARISRTLLIFGGFAAVVGAAFYPIYFRPLLQVEQYRKDQATNRSGIVQEDVQPPEFADTFEWPSKEGYSRAASAALEALHQVRLGNATCHQRASGKRRGYRKTWFSHRLHQRTIVRLSSNTIGALQVCSTTYVLSMLLCPDNPPPANESSQLRQSTITDFQDCYRPLDQRKDNTLTNAIAKWIAMDSML